MPIPRTLTSRRARGLRPGGRRRRVARRPDRRDRHQQPRDRRQDLAHAFFGFGMMRRLSLEPGKHGAPADSWPGATRSSTRRPAACTRPTPICSSPAPAGYVSPLRGPQHGQHRPPALGRSPLRHLGRRPPGRARPGLDEVARRRRHARLVGRRRASPMFGDAAAVRLLVGPPGRRSRPRLPVDGQARARPRQQLRPDPWLVRWDGGREVSAWPLADAEVAGSMHTITQTRDWLILADSGNFKVDPAAMLGGDKSVSIDDEVPLYLLRKDAVEATASGQPLAASASPWDRPPGTTTACGTTATASGSCSSTWTCSIWPSPSTRPTRPQRQLRRSGPCRAVLDEPRPVDPVGGHDRPRVGPS